MDLVKQEKGRGPLDGKDGALMCAGANYRRCQIVGCAPSAHEHAYRAPMQSPALSMSRPEQQRQ